MTVLTRSTTGPRRNLSTRKFTFVIQEDNMDRESDYDSSEEEEETESEYEPPSESESDDDTLSVESDDETATVESEDAESMQERIDNLRAELALAESIMKKWQEEHEAEIRANNNTFLPLILALTLTWGLYTWLEWTVISKRMHW